MTPILLLFFGITPTTAVATDLWFATFTKIAAVIIHHREQKVEWLIVRRLWLGSLPAALMISLALLSGALTAISSKFLTSTIGGIILITAISLPMVNWLKSQNYSTNVFNRHSTNQLQKYLTPIAGLILGLLVSLTSVGAGALGTIFLIYLYPTQLPPSKLVGTDIAHAIPLAFVAGLGYLVAGKVDGELLRSLLLGSLPAAVLGSLVADRFSNNKLRLCLMIILSVSGLKLMF
jgi:hypothetical protein